MGAPARLDWQWAARTGGVLSPRDKAALIAPLLRAIAVMPGERVRVALGRRGSGRLDLEALRWPDSRLARDAEAEARDVLSPHVLQHSFRTYLFGLVLAQLDGAAVDEEMGFVSSMLHDIALEHPTPGRCFAVVGAEKAHDFALQHGAAPDRAALIRAAVAGHLTPGAADNLGDPAGFVSAGALLDVAGVRLQETDPAWVHEVLTRHPRLDFKQHLQTAIATEAKLVPGGRTEWLRRVAAFPLLLRLAPFEE